MDAVLLSGPSCDRPTASKLHKAELEGLARQGRCAWIRLASSFAETRFRLTPVEHTFPESGSNEAIGRELRQWHSLQRICFNRVYLVAQEHVKESIYDITDYIERCLSGDYSVADRLRGRTIFGLHQIETDAHDLLSSVSGSRLIEHDLKPYIHEFEDFIGHTILGFCCQLPLFLSPLETPVSTVPWSPDLNPYFKSVWGERLTECLPLVFYGVYDSAEVRSTFWNSLTLQFSKSCIGGFRKFCHRLGVRFVIEIPAGERSLGYEIGTILECSDGAIVVGPNSRSKSNGDQNSLQKPKTASQETLRFSNSNLPPINTSRRFLIAKWVASRKNARSAQVFGIWRYKPPTSMQYAFDRIVGFNSWMAEANQCAHDSDSMRRNKHSSQGFASRHSPLNHDMNHDPESPCLLGEPQRSVLIISPLHSLWTKTDERTWREITGSWAWLGKAVWNLGYDFDIASENDCVNAKFDRKNRTLNVNTGSYSVILVPSCISLQENTVNLFTEVIAGRGKLIVDEPVPFLLNGKLRLDTQPLELFLYHQRTTLLKGTVAEKTETLKQLLRKWIKPILQVYAKPDNILTDAIQSQHLRAGQYDQFYFFNASESSIETLIEIRGESMGVEEWGITDGKSTVVNYWHANGNTYLTRDFGCGQSWLVTTRRKEKGPLSLA